MGRLRRSLAGTGPVLLPEGPSKILGTPALRELLLCLIYPSEARLGFELDALAGRPVLCAIAEPVPAEEGLFLPGAAISLVGGLPADSNPLSARLFACWADSGLFFKCMFRRSSAGASMAVIFPVISSRALEADLVFLTAGIWLGSEGR